MSYSSSPELGAAKMDERSHQDARGHNLSGCTGHSVDLKIKTGSSIGYSKVKLLAAIFRALISCIDSYNHVVVSPRDE